MADSESAIPSDREPGAVTKYCGRCKQDKDVAEFGRNRRRPDGLAEYCKA